MLDDLASQYSARFEDTVMVRTGYRLRRVQAPTIAQMDSVSRVVRIQLTEERNREMLKKYPNDTALWKTHPERDSFAQVTIPPRPSDYRWANENCYGGRAR